MVNLRSLVQFFKDNILKHDRVAGCGKLLSANEDEYIYEISRKDDLSTVKVYISDAYEYNSGDYEARPKAIKAGDFILVDSNVPSAYLSVVEQARKDRVAIGPFRKLLGALNSPEMWKYRMPEEKNK